MKTTMYYCPRCGQDCEQAECDCQIDHSTGAVVPAAPAVAPLAGNESTIKDEWRHNYTTNTSSIRATAGSQSSAPDSHSWRPAVGASVLFGADEPTPLVHGGFERVGQRFHFLLLGTLGRVGARRRDGWGVRAEAPRQSEK